MRAGEGNDQPVGDRAFDEGQGPAENWQEGGDCEEGESGEAGEEEGEAEAAAELPVEESRNESGKELEQRA